MQRRSLTVVALGLVPSLWVVWLLWLAPVEGLTADRTALAARDFTVLWAAGKAATSHSLEMLSNPAAFTAYLRTMFGTGMPSQIWPYPPPILLIAQPLAELPLGIGLLLYTALGLAALWGAMSLAELSIGCRIAVLLSPAVATNALAGQNGALVGALLCGGLLLLGRNPLIAGLLLGAVSIKPQFMVLLPVCLAATRQWLSALTGCVTAFTLSLLAAYMYGYAPWIDFVRENQVTVSAYLGAPWQSDSAQSIFTSAFMAARSLGAGLAGAYSIQLVVSLGCVYSAWKVWRAPCLDTNGRVAATLPLILLAAPWVHTYDMPALAVSLVLLLPRAGVVQRVLLALAWLWPGLSPTVAFPPALAALSVGSIAWLAASPARVRFSAPQPAWSSR